MDKEMAIIILEEHIKTLRLVYGYELSEEDMFKKEKYIMDKIEKLKNE